MYSIGQLSKKTGVTVRTLDYYDEIQLLKPSSATEGGHRLYDQHDVLRLQQILALKYMGFSLEQIKEKLGESAVNWQQSLEQQLDMVRQQQKQLQALEQALNGVLYSIQFEEEVKWSLIFEIIRLFQQDKEIVQHLYDPYLNKKEQKIIKDIQAERSIDDVQEWSDIIGDVRAVLNKDPSSEEVQRLAERWMQKVYDMFGDNHYLAAKMWDVIKEHSGGIAVYPMDEDIVQFMNKAIGIMYERKESS
ncbi:MerR family transcriptional regulator [Gracilibacillus alcaliphilus]|uniref:MerR family transcriptional regulator n=1 Tax=Gracilibacillus alcaliphilus TaxID=1401441 RepID=UPI00195BDB9F|nr:MerR family transcriptional regulator [Gracilibacillus alcaliphilus]MBM7675739.1 DNA-binding transcriptional MerR regulator [Gracilibacillus alcaliphilus]